MNKYLSAKCDNNCSLKCSYWRRNN